jgi:hypothetical protein
MADAESDHQAYADFQRQGDAEQCEDFMPVNQKIEET